MPNNLYLKPLREKLDYKFSNIKKRNSEQLAKNYKASVVYGLLKNNLTLTEKRDNPFNSMLAQEYAKIIAPKIKLPTDKIIAKKLEIEKQVNEVPSDVSKKILNKYSKYNRVYLK